MGRMLEATDIAQAVDALLAPKALSGVRMLITAGPTFEAVDAVRGITNQSSGKMGYAVARAALDAGARVTLISGPTQLSAPSQAERVDVVSADDMLNAVKARVTKSDIFVSVAAVADYRPAKVSEQKIKKSDSARTLELVPTTDILAYVAALPRAPFCVGFAAESEKLNWIAEEKRKAQEAAAARGEPRAERDRGPTTTRSSLDDEGSHPLERAPKEVVARQLVAHIAKLYRRRAPGALIQNRR